MKISTLFYTIKQGFANIFRNKWYSLASIATISACLFLFGLFYCIVANFQNILKTAEEGVSVTVFFHSDMDNCESHVDGQIPSEQRLEEIGQEIAKLAKEKNIMQVVFDRNGYLYHGRIKELAEAARNGGLKF